MHDGRVFHARGTATGSEIEKRVAEHLAAIASNDLPAVRRHGRWLFDQLIAPVVREISPDSDLVIVADAGLQSFPFATLVFPDASFLIDRHPLAMAPSASVFLRMSTPAHTDLPILGVAEPTPEGFVALPGSAAEVAALTRLYPRGRNLVGAECSPEQFLKAANNAALVHFAGHAQTDSVQPPKSALIFQSANGAPARLTAETIGRAHFSAHPLIVLAACGTGSGKIRRNEGIESLASAFLQAGARGVVATLWDVDDAPSVHLFRELHRGFRNGARTIDAVRDAQRACMHSTDPELRAPSVWASTVVIGTF
jgi:CHAT domain-containing protein